MPKAGQSMPLDARLQVSPDEICQANWSSGVEAIEALTALVSGTTLIEPGPDELELHSILSAAAAAENVMVAAFALGFGCAWKTGEAAYDPEIKSAFGLAPNDAIVGFLYLGSNANAPPAPPLLDLSEYVIEWDNRASS